MPSFIDLTSFDLKLSGDGAATISCGKRFHVLMVRAGMSADIDRSVL